MRNARFFENREYESLIHDIRVKKNLTVKKLEELSGVNLTQIIEFSNGTSSPVYLVNYSGKNKFEIKESVKKIAKVLNVDVETLFPRYFCYFEKKRFTNTQVIEICISEFTRKISSENTIFINTEEFWDIIKKILKNNKHFEILQMRYIYDMTYLEISNKFNVSSSFIEHIVKISLTKIRNSYRSKKFKDFYTF